MPARWAAAREPLVVLRLPALAAVLAGAAGAGGQHVLTGGSCTGTGAH